MRARARTWFGSLALVLLWALAASGQPLTWDRDAGGTPAPPCYFVDDSVTPPLLVRCSKSNPLPSAPGVSAATDPFGFGRIWFKGTYAPQPQPLFGLFTDSIQVVTVRQSAGGNVQVDRSADGGKTFPISQINPLPAGHTFKAGLIFAPSGPFFLSLCTRTAGPAQRVCRSASLNGWTASADIGAVNDTLSAALGVQGTTVLVWGQNGVNVAQVCRSADTGATFAACVLLTGNGPPQNDGGYYTITSPTPGTWLLIDVAAKVWRSTDDGASFTAIQTLTGGGGTGVAVLCVTATRCVATSGGTFYFSNDAGLTWNLSSSTAVGADAICNFGNGVLYARATTADSSATAPYVGGFQTLNNGQSWLPSTTNGGSTNANVQTDTLTCSPGGKGFATARDGFATVLSFFNPTVAGGGLLIGSTGNALGVDANGNVTANQGLAATGPLPWFQVPVQGPTIQNAAPVVSAANASATVTLTGVAGTRVCVREIAIKATGAQAVFTLTAQDGATVVWDQGTQTATLTGPALRFTGSPLFCASTGNNLVINIGAGGVGAITTTSTIADRG